MEAVPVTGPTTTQDLQLHHDVHEYASSPGSWSLQPVVHLVYTNASSLADKADYCCLARFKPGSSKLIVEPASSFPALDATNSKCSHCERTWKSHDSGVGQYGRGARVNWPVMAPQHTLPLTQMTTQGNPIQPNTLHQRRSIDCLTWHSVTECCICTNTAHYDKWTAWQQSFNTYNNV